VIDAQQQFFPLKILAVLCLYKAIGWKAVNLRIHVCHFIYVML